MTLEKTDHKVFMARALQLARRAWGQTHPNPMVGAVIVESGRIVAEGWHHATGKPHAEIEALNALGRSPSADATLYVTLEPCSTHGRTGACTKAIIQSGIGQVIVGAVDPNPDHAGRGLEMLRQAGIGVTAGVLADECTDLNLIFNHWIVRKTPLVAAKLATTLDGKFAAASGQSKWVTGEVARADVMRWRRYFPAIAISSQTAMVDNPSLTSRLDGQVWCPQRLVLDRRLQSESMLDTLSLYNDSNANRTIVVCSEYSDARKFEQKGLAIWQMPEVDGKLNFDKLRMRCAEVGIVGVYIEPGPTLATHLIEGRIADYLFHYIAPKYMSDQLCQGIGNPRHTKTMQAAISLNGIRHEAHGLDLLVRGQLQSADNK